MDAAEDVVAETFLVAHQRRNWYDPAAGSMAAWLFGIATNLLRRHRREGAHPRGSDSADHQVWEAVTSLYWSAEILLSPKLRAALLRALADLRGLETSEVEIDGRRLIVIQQVDLNRKVGDGLLFDPDTGRTVGARTVFLSERAKLIQPSDGPELDPGVGYQALWTHAIVDEVGETGA